MFQEHRAAAWFFTISREISHYAFFFVGFFDKGLSMKIFSVPTDVINICGKIRIRKSRHYGNVNKRNDSK